jgi:hypothetical protein
MAMLQQSGLFKFMLVESGLVKAKESNSHSWNLKAKVLAQWNGKEWESWHEYEDHFCYGRQTVINKDQAVNEYGVQALQRVGWDGNFDNIANLPETAPEFVGSVKPEEYNGETQYKINSIFDADYEPGIKSVDPQTAKSLNNMFGSKIRSLINSKPKSSGQPAVVPIGRKTGPVKQQPKQAQREEVTPFDDALDELTRPGASLHDVNEQDHASY